MGECICNDFSKELLSSQLFSHSRNIHLSALPCPTPSRNEGCLFTQQLSQSHSCRVRKRFFSPENIFRHGKVMNAPRESQTWAISQVGLMICPQHVEFFYIIMKKISEKSREKSDDVAWKKVATWLLILGTKAGRPKNGMETGESCSGNDVSIWWLMERYDVFGIADLMVRHLRRSRVDTFCPSSFVCFGPSSSRNIVQLSSSSKCNFRTLAEGANDLGHFDTHVSKVRWGILRNVLCIYYSRHTSNFVNVSTDIYAWLERFISLEDQAIE